MWQLEEELEDVHREDDYFFRMLHCVVGDESSPRLLRPLRAKVWTQSSQVLSTWLLKACRLLLYLTRVDGPVHTLLLYLTRVGDSSTWSLQPSTWV